MLSEFFQFLIIIGNIVGWLGIYYLVDKKIDKKALKYWRIIRESAEGKDLFTLLKEANKLLNSSEAKELMKELTAGLTELHEFLKTLREKAEQGTAEDAGEEKDLLPRLE